MKPKIEIKREDSVAICTLEGELSYDSVETVRSKIDPCLQTKLTAFILDLTQVPYVDSTGLSLLMRCHAHMLRLGGKLIIVGATDTVLRVFQLMKLHSVLTLVKTLDEAKALLK